MVIFHHRDKHLREHLEGGKTLVTVPEVHDQFAPFLRACDEAENQWWPEYVLRQSGSPHGGQEAERCGWGQGEASLSRAHPLLTSFLSVATCLPRVSTAVIKRHGPRASWEGKVDVDYTSQLLFSIEGSQGRNPNRHRS